MIWILLYLAGTAAWIAGIAEYASDKAEAYPHAAAAVVVLWPLSTVVCLFYVARYAWAHYQGRHA
jgi:hypothetical protein